MGFCGVESLGLTIILSQQKRMTDMIMGIPLGLITWLLGGAS
jgi:hypothetical protein